jgi:ubiquinone/menaquinone biosynthesis C-methylase UbiE
MAITNLPKRIISEIYSRTAATLYEPIVVRGTFRMFASDLEELVGGQGTRAVEAAGDGPILDMPVGTAHFTLPFAKQHKGIVIGADIAHGMTVKTMARAREERIDNIRVVQADAHALPFKTGSFPAIMCSNGLQVIPGLRETLTELHRVLARGGLMQVSIVNVPLGRVLPDAASDHLPTMFKSREAMVDAMRRAGLTIENLATSRLATLIEARKG